jgi:exopolysaccharide biosynthesis polyprenyl glycosylphosphotransferase
MVGMGLWTTALLWLKESVMRRVLVRLHRQPEYQHAVVVVADEHMDEMADRLVEHYRDWGVQVVQRLALRGVTSDSFAAVLTQQPVDEVILAPAPGSYAATPAVLSVCEQLGVTTRIIVDMYRPVICKLSTELIDGAPVIELHPTTQNFGALTVKLFFDRAVAALLLLAGLPLGVLVALAIRLTSRGPVLIHQARVGQNGRVFIMVKFRSMVANAEAQRAALEEANELVGWAFKLHHDPRITPLGRMLRRFSVDELPQLWNVLIGDMSLVGPRPALPTEVDKFQLWERRRCSMKPGMTGLWQVSGRTRMPNADWVACDLKYIDTWSLALDLRILLKTVWVVVSGQGL